MDESRQLLNARVAELLHAALVTLRNYTYPAAAEDDNRLAECNDLADLVHNLPRFVVGHDEHAIDSAEQLREAVVDHVRRFYPGIDPATHRYVELLDMDAEKFLTRYRHNVWAVPTPTAR